MSKVNKNKQTQNRRNNTFKTPDMTTRSKVNTSEGRKPKVGSPTMKAPEININIGRLKNLIPKSYSDLGPMGRMAAREKQLEDRNHK
jgi:hypothetical protein